MSAAGRMVGCAATAENAPQRGLDDRQPSVVGLKLAWGFHEKKHLLKDGYF